MHFIRLTVITKATDGQSVTEGSPICTIQGPINISNCQCTDPWIINTLMQYETIYYNANAKLAIIQADSGSIICPPPPPHLSNLIKNGISILAFVLML